MQTHPKGLWLHSKKFDLIFFQLSALVFLLFLLPYQFWGFAVVFPIYNFYLMFFGLPHNYLTWATIFPSSSRKTMKMSTVWNVLIFCAIICILIPMTRDTDLNSWLLSFITYFSLWHAYRQHHGICKVYDSVQAKRTGDFTIFEDRKALDLFFGLAAMAIVVWAFTHPKIDYLLSSKESYRLVFPQIPQWLFQTYCAVTAGIGIYALKRSVYDRYKRGAFLPYPQLLLMFMALLTYYIPYYFLPLEAIPLSVAIGTMFHNFQYFGFVWLYERNRSELLAEEGEPLQPIHQWSLKNKWPRYFAVALAYSFLVVGFYLITPSQVGLTFIYFLGLSHYIVDGYVWRRDHNLSLNKVMSRLANLPNFKQKDIPVSFQLSQEKASFSQP